MNDATADDAVFEEQARGSRCRLFSGMDLWELGRVGLSMEKVEGEEMEEMEEMEDGREKNMYESRLEGEGFFLCALHGRVKLTLSLR